ncbi:MAG TPA: hypothetical protein VFN09_10880 [Rhodanobacteraceae bacterium]|nr:hypothetical protein [Rhodanobacteraceae bacterium]
MQHHTWIPARRIRHWWLTLILLGATASATPPYSGTIFIDPDIITAADPNAFLGITYAGQGVRNLFDRRCGCFENLNVYLFDATYADGRGIEVQVDPEFASEALAAAPARFYASVVGQLPQALRDDVHMLWIHRGDEAFGGGNQSLLIHTGAIAQSYIDTGILEEALAHEASHTSLDDPLASSSAWLAAQAADLEFISTYAADNPGREDVAESFLVWLAARRSSGRIDTATAATIETTIPNRLDVFDAQGFALYPYTGLDTVFADGFEPL